MSDDITKLLAEGANDALAELSQEQAGTQVGELAGLLHALLQRKADLEADLQTLNNEVNNLKSSRLPEAMAALGAQEWVTTGGLKVKVKEVVQASLPKDETRANALEWLTEHGLGDVIKHGVTVAINKGDNDTRQKVLDAVMAVQAPIVVSTQDDVHPQTLTAVVRKLLRDGTAVPLDLFKVYTGRVVDVTKV